MKKQHLIQFIKRGLPAASGGPVVLAAVYGILGATGVITALSPREVVLGILTVTFLAFTAGGITVVYTLEKLPLPCAILLHGATLYLDYLLIYLLNGWLKQQLLPILIFSVSFLVGFSLIWLGVYFQLKAKTRRLNRMLHAD